MHQISRRQISRRRFVALTATGVAVAPLALMARGMISAQQIVDRIKENLGVALEKNLGVAIEKNIVVEWKPETVDTFKAGDPSTVVTGIVTTNLASLDVLGRAVKTGANLIVSCEPTFFARADSPTPPARRGPGPGSTGRDGPPGTSSPQPASDPVFSAPVFSAPVFSAPVFSAPVFSAKDAFIKKHNLVVFRFSDHWRLRTPDPFAQGLAGVLGWSKFADASDPRLLSIPEISLDALVLHVKKSLKVRDGMRIVGDPQLRVRKVALLPGSTPIAASLEVLPNVDAIIAGEVREWESVEYVRDTVALGGKKALTLVGRIVSEGPGMQVCAQWLKSIVPEVASTWISAGDPYWRPIG